MPLALLVLGSEQYIYHCKDCWNKRLHKAHECPQCQEYNGDNELNQFGKESKNDVVRGNVPIESEIDGENS